MLVLSRKKNESIVLGHDITITVVEIRGDKVRLGIEAPKEGPVHRREVFDAINASLAKRLVGVGEPVGPTLAEALAEVGAREFEMDKSTG